MEKEYSLTVGPGATSQQVSISGTSAQSATITGFNSALIYATADCFVRSGSNPTALSGGTDQFVPANTLLRVVGIDPAGAKLAFKTTGATGSVYITPGA